MALARSNSHYGSNSQSRGRGRARVGHSHRVCVAHRGAVGGCSTVVSSHIGWRHKLEGFSRGESRKVGGERAYLSGGLTFGGGKVGWRNGASQRQRRFDGPLVLWGGPTALLEEEDGEGRLKSQGVRVKVVLTERGQTAVRWLPIRCA
jgi:hypothetical protein